MTLITTDSTDSFLYFSYGSNMLSERLLARCPSARFVGAALAQDWKVEFSKMSKDNSGKATLIPSVGHAQPGVVFSIDSNEISKLDQAEGAGYGYDRLDSFAVVSAETGRQFNAVTYIASGPQDGLKPYNWYLALVLAGALQQKLSPELIMNLQSVEFIIDPDPERAAYVEAVNVLKLSGYDTLNDILIRHENN